MRPDRVLETVLYARDLDAAERFYVDVIGLERHSRLDGRHIFLRCGRQMVLIFDPDATRRPAPPGNPLAVPLHGADGAGHVCFAADREELDHWRRHLASHAVAVETEVEWPAGGRSIYVRDPAGNSVELAESRIWGIA